MIKHLILSAGHNIYNGPYFDNGAAANGIKEANFVKETVAIIKSNVNCKVYDVTPYNEKFISNKAAHRERAKRVNKIYNSIPINERNKILYLDIHMNSGGGTGPEVLLNANNPLSYKYGLNITKQISKITGLRNRGVKHKPGFWSISMTIPPSIIVEGGFLDSPDNKDLERLTPKIYANSILHGLNLNNKMEVSMNISNQELSIDGQDVALKGFKKNGKSYIEVRQLCDLLGFTVDYKDNKIILNPRNELINVNGEITTIESIKLNKNTNFIKLAALENLIKLNINWDHDNKIIIINNKGE